MIRVRLGIGGLSPRINISEFIQERVSGRCRRRGIPEIEAYVAIAGLGIG
jgi:hypothetical protein